ncbi:Mitochondrial ribonuclease P protein 1 homolog [Eumeta japonica]|uniref:Mitochondrial ribonuclease P protein 1 homolog n=1 Tax=Eumeta variegata TaxID=151549 RepID=A0A4C1VQ37_EUMVA|nr:Mitochondrial ribonuclease P protein 1 homolog [Eumeta japonica]
MDKEKRLKITKFECKRGERTQQAKKEARRMEYELKPIEETKEYPDDKLYGISHDALYLRIRDKSVNNFDNYRALQAMMYGQKLVIDCSYEDKMVSRESLNAAKQMTFVFAYNRIHKEPFDLHLCNTNNEKLSLAKAKRDGLKMAKLPLDRYLEWGSGGKKNLNINHMVSILQDLKISGDWEYALKHVPRRKLLDTQIDKIQSKHNIDIFKRDNKLRSRVIRRLFDNKPQKFKKSLHDDETYY